MNKSWRIAYAIQSVSINMDAAAGPAVLIRHTVQGLRQAGHQTTVLHLQGRAVKAADGPNWLEGSRTVPQGISGTGIFKAVESGLRRLQTDLRLPYFGFFESLRFYEAALNILPDYDVCHEYYTLFGLGPTLACRRLGIPRVMSVDADLLLERALIGQPLRGFQAAVARWAARLSFRTAGKLLCVSEAARCHFIDTWGIEPGKIAVVANGVDADKFDTAEARESAQARPGFQGSPVIIFVGGFQPWHGLEILVDAFADVVKESPQARLILVGDGPVRGDIEKKIAGLHLNQSVLITGYVDHENVPLWLASADIAVAPYPQLPFELWFSPLKLYEYMAAGKAIIASQAGQIAEVIHHGHNGLLVEPGDKTQLAQAIIHLTGDPEGRKRLGENARQQAKTKHSWYAYTGRLEKIYQAILQ